MYSNFIKYQIFVSSNVSQTHENGCSIHIFDMGSISYSAIAFLIIIAIFNLPHENFLCNITSRKHYFHKLGSDPQWKSQVIFCNKVCNEHIAIDYLGSRVIFGAGKKRNLSCLINGCLLISGAQFSHVSHHFSHDSLTYPHSISNKTHMLYPGHLLVIKNVLLANWTDIFSHIFFFYTSGYRYPPSCSAVTLKQMRSCAVQDCNYRFSVTISISCSSKKTPIKATELLVTS